MRRIVFLVAVVAGVVGLAPAVSARGTSGPYCGIYWGSLPKAADVYSYTSSPITNLRVGRHSCFDRFVIDLGPSATGASEVAYGYQVAYGQPVDEETGQPLPIAGGAFLDVLVNAPAHDADSNPTYRPADRFNAANVAGFRTFRQVAFLGTFESQTEVVLGVRARLPFRVFILAGPGTGSRLVVDVAHRW